MRRKMNKKGFLGPIGDDLPSLVPLIVALVIFFSTFTLSFNIFSKKNEAFHSDVTTLSIARAVRGSGYIPDYETFKELCTSVQSVVEVRFVLGITDQLYTSELDPSSQVSLVEEISDYDRLEGFFYEYGDSGDILMCSNIGDDQTEQNRLGGLDTKKVVKIQPLVVQEEVAPGNVGGAYPMHLVVISWR